jgi:anti-sigma-K factor RskA
MSDCEQLKTGYDEYALGVLEGEERAAIEQHLAGNCPRCTAAVAEARTFLAQLAYTAPDATPPHELRARILESAAERPRRTIPAWALVAAAGLAAFAIFNGIQTLRLQKEIAQRQEEARAARARGQVLAAELDELKRMNAVLSNSATRQLSLKPAVPGSTLPEIRAYWNQGLGLVLLGQQIPAPASDRTLQLWVIPRGGQPISAGIFRPDEKGELRLIASTALKLAEGQLIAITDEPAGGRPQPTTAPIWVGRVS